MGNFNISSDCLYARFILLSCQNGVNRSEIIMTLHIVTYFNHSMIETEIKSQKSQKSESQKSM